MCHNEAKYEPEKPKMGATTASTNIAGKMCPAIHVNPCFATLSFMFSGTLVYEQKFVLEACL